MTEQFEQIREMIFSMASDVVAGLIAFTPKLVGALVVLLVGWLFAKIVRAILVRSIRVSLDGVLEKSGLTEVLERSAMTAAPSEILGRVVYWLLMILFVMGAAEIIGLTAVTNAIQRLLGYIPSVVSAAIILAAGIFLARFVSNIVASAATAAGISYAAGLGSVVRISIVVMVGVVTAEQLGIDTQILVTVITVTVAAITFGMGLAFALGGRQVVYAILAGHYLRQTVSEGNSVEVLGEAGVVEEIGAVTTAVRSGDKVVRIPNHRMIEEIVKQTP